MKKKLKYYEKENLTLYLNDNDLSEIARLITGSNTSGILDSEDDKGRPTRITWNITINKFYN
jgi:hypothetical protein